MDNNTKAIYDDLSRQITEKERRIEEIQTKIDAGGDKEKIARWEKREKTLNADIQALRKQQNELLGNFYFTFI